jgi:radical SAM superfamily enzyme YgiQ (UPF0313 family)
VRVLLVNPKTGTRYPQLPLGLLSLAGALKAEGYEAVVLDRNTGTSIAEIVAGADKADAIGISVWSCGAEDGAEISRGLRAAHPGIPIIVGGPHASALPAQTAVVLACNAGVVGEGEAALVEVLRDGDLKNRRGWIVNTPTGDIANLPMPAYGAVDWKRYKPHPPHGKWMPFVPMVTSRGCPYQCRFCSKSVFGSKHRSREPWQIVEEVDYLRKVFGIREVAFYDDTFTIDRKRMLELCRMLRERRLGVHWSCETRVNTVDVELLREMKSAGCFSVSFGIESANQKTLDYIKKGISVEQARLAVRLAKKAGLSTTGYFMFVPGMEGAEERANTVELAKALGLDYAQFATLTPLPGSALYDPLSSSTRYGGTGAGSGYEAQATRAFYLRPRYVARRAARAATSWSEMKLLVKGAAMMLRSS